MVFAILALLLGAGHIVFGFMFFKSFTLEMMWFQGAGIAMMVTGLANFNTVNAGVLILQNTLMSAFTIALIILAPLPQIWLGVILFFGLLMISIVNMSARNRSKISFSERP